MTETQEKAWQATAAQPGQLPAGPTVPNNSRQAGGQVAPCHLPGASAASSCAGPEAQTSATHKTQQPLQAGVHPHTQRAGASRVTGRAGYGKNFPILKCVVPFPEEEHGVPKVIGILNPIQRAWSRANRQRQSGRGTEGLQFQDSLGGSCSATSDQGGISLLEAGGREAFPGCALTCPSLSRTLGVKSDPGRGNLFPAAPPQ